MSALDETHWVTAKGVLRYLAGTQDMSITFGANTQWRAIRILTSRATCSTKSDEEPLARQGPEIVRETFPTREVPAKIMVNNPMFRDVFDCESYSFVNKSLTYGSREAHTLGRRKKDVAQSFGVRSEWDGTPPLKVFQFLRKFAKACDDNDVSEA
ncbi:hypothetical protein MMPV_010062 [Pyropia vietnamensis]